MNDVSTDNNFIILIEYKNEKIIILNKKIILWRFNESRIKYT